MSTDAKDKLTALLLSSRDENLTIRIPSEVKRLLQREAKEQTRLRKRRISVSDVILAKLLSR